MKKHYWLSNDKMTVAVYTDMNNIIIDAAPIVLKFKGQHIDNLINWMKKQKEFKYEYLGERG